MALWILANGESMDELTGFSDSFGSFAMEANGGARGGYQWVNASLLQLIADLKGARTGIWSKLWMGRNGQLATGKFFQSYYDGLNERLRFQLVFVANVGTCVQCSTVNGATVTTLFTCALPHYSQTANVSSLATCLGHFVIEVNYLAAGSVRVYRDATLAGEFIGDPRVGGSTSLTSARLQNPNTNTGFAECLMTNIIFGDEDTRALRILTQVPNAAGDVSTFSSALFSNIDEIGEVGTDFNESLVAGQKAIFNITNIAAAFGTPNIRQLSVRSRAQGATGGGPTKMRHVLKTAAVEYQGAEKTPSAAAYDLHIDEWDLNPGTGLAWTKTEIDALQLGHLSVA